MARDVKRRLRPSNDLTIEKYEVSGETCVAVATELRRVQATIPLLNGHDSVTDMAPPWTEQDGAAVYAAQPIRVLLPRVSADSRGVRRCFGRYRRALEAHEAEHVAAYRKLLAAHRQLIGLSLEEVKAGSREIQDKGNREAAEFDVKTAHGGRACNFPPPDCPHR